MKIKRNVCAGSAIRSTCANHPDRQRRGDDGGDISAPVRRSHAEHCCRGRPFAKPRLDERRATTRPVARQLPLGRFNPKTVRQRTSRSEICGGQAAHQPTKLRISGSQKSVKRRDVPRAPRNREKAGLFRRFLLDPVSDTSCGDYANDRCHLGGDAGAAGRHQPARQRNGADGGNGIGPHSGQSLASRTADLADCPF